MILQKRTKRAHLLTFLFPTFSLIVSKSTFLILFCWRRDLKSFQPGLEIIKDLLLTNKSFKPILDFLHSYLDAKSRLYFLKWSHSPVPGTCWTLDTIVDIISKLTYSPQYWKNDRYFEINYFHWPLSTVYFPPPSLLTPDPHLERPPVWLLTLTWGGLLSARCCGDCRLGSGSRLSLRSRSQQLSWLGHPSGIPGFCVCQTSPASRDSRIVRRKQNSLIISLHTSQMSMTLCSDTW